MLLRWNRAGAALISPAQFIPAAEHSGLIIPIGRWVLQATCTRLAAWHTHEALGDLTLAANVSARQLADPEFVDTVRAALADTGADPTRLKLEVTESAVVQDVDSAIAKLDAIRKLGVRISLDDFGTGYSSLAYLARLPLDQVKIDQSFVRQLDTSPRYATIVAATIAMGHGLGLEVIAEGVETRTQLEFLRAQGCDSFQGFLLARPVSVATFEQQAGRMRTADA